MNEEELATATRAELQEYLESWGFAVYESEDTEKLRVAAMLNASMEGSHG